MKNILILNWKDIKHPQVGGAEIIVYELAKRLVKDGNKVTWFTRSFKASKKQETMDGIKVVRRGNLVTQYIFAPFYYWSLKNKPDLVIDMSNTIYWQTPFWVKKSKKVAYLNQLGMQVFNFEYNIILALVGRLVERVQYFPYKNMQFIVYSYSTKDDLIKMGISKKKIKVFPLGLDHDRYSPGKKSKTPLFICVNRLVRMKRTDLAIKAMKTVAKKHPNTKLSIIGSGYERENLEKLRNSLKLQDNVYFQDEDTWFFKKSTKDQKVKLMQRAWALVFPSVKEGWGMTVTECAACGTPSIVTDVTGLRDSVKKGKTGLVISSDPNEDELAGAMIKIIEDSVLRKRLSKEAINWSKEFNWDKCYREFNNIIQKLA